MTAQRTPSYGPRDVGDRLAQPSGAVGLGSGYVLPTVLHYRGELRALLPTYQSPTSPLSFVVAPTVSPSMTGLTMTGTL